MRKERSSSTGWRTGNFGPEAVISRDAKIKRVRSAEHAVAVVTRKGDGLSIDNANKPRITALIGHGWSALMINGRHKEHVAAFNERLMLGRDFAEHDTRFDIVGKPPCIETVL
jgi:hypothetical protein